MRPQGLSTRAAEAYHRDHGYNEISEKKRSFLGKALKRCYSPISLMLLLASGLSFASGRSFDGSFILALFAINILVTVEQEHKADSAIEKLNEHLAVSVRALRDGEWRTLPARELVPGDAIELKSGGIVPADARVAEAESLSLNESALTGESLPVEKKLGETLYSGSFVSSGIAFAEVSAIGSNTSFGKAVSKSSSKPKRSALESDILRITRFLSVLSVASIAVLTLALYLDSASWLDIVRLDLSLAIAGIPISLPTVMTLIIAIGVVALSKKQVIVRRLSSLEDLANTDLLLTDKTGTLTKNQITVSEAKGYGASVDEVRALGALIAREEPDEAMNAALTAGASAAQAEKVRYIPADSSRKRSTLIYRYSGSLMTLSLGAPQIIESLCDLGSQMKARFEADVESFAQRGYRTIALARASGEEEMQMSLLGIFALSDELREDAAEVVSFLVDNGIEVCMVTGDNRAIAREIADKLHMPGQKVVSRDELMSERHGVLGEEVFRETKAFAEILPEDKLMLVEEAKRFYTVASNGDGINDLPAVRAANVGFAVANAVDALKSSADIVLLSPGIAVMRDAFIEGRKIFARLYTYSLYRISESFRLIVSIVILGLLTKTYPLSPLQLIVLALLNDIPIISLAADRVRVPRKPARINVKRRFEQSILYGTVGIANSIILFFLATKYLHLPLPVVETLFFLKLTVSGHLLIYVAHTKERWWRYLPSGSVILATTLTQAIATLLAVTGWLMPASISWPMAAFVWVWALLFMQASELAKVGA